MPDQADPSAEMKSTSVGKKFWNLYQKHGIILVFALIFIICSLLSPTFLRIQNLVNIVRQNAAITILACGITMLLISGHVDLSGGYVLCMAGVFGTSVMSKTHNLPLSILTSIVFAMLAESVNGWLITAFGLPAFIATLAMKNVAQGIVQVYTDGVSIVGIGSMAFMGQGTIGPIPFPIILMLVMIIITDIILRQTKLGMYAYAIGGNRRAAIASGVNVKRKIRQFYLFHGFMVGLAGVVTMGRLNSGVPQVGEGYEFDAITAAVVGGTSFSGGVGNVYRTLVGSVIVGMMNNILVLMKVSTQWQLVFKGILIALAVIIDTVTREKTKT